ncbi:putative ankyrin repeat protein [Cotonvirus japonicus]|uniref:Ankyrin repeat protein n=1 Tax=Cotonvirus japonicus TaxID=2811091 RepID=A0ABM7NRH5_9VIRU|nr:putative ankyrin repeat protein [Cotonvirus japonicus]BCS82765.1 putative ankyrin repeat protein [Cotonvirus japonicus]
MDSSLTNKKFYKFINENWIQRDYLYKEGLNFLNKPFEPQGHCVPGGLYFTDIKNILEFLDYGMRLVEITIPVDARVVKDSLGLHKWRADKIIVKNIGLITDISTIKFIFEQGVNMGKYISKLYSYSIVNNYYELLEYLIENFLEHYSNLRRDIILTPVNIFIYNEKIIQLLIKHDARISNRFMSDIIEYEKLNLILTIILYKPSNIETLYTFIMEYHKFNIIKMIDQYIPKIKSFHSINDKIFDRAVKKGDIDIVKYMIDNKFYISINLFSYILNKNINGSIIVYLWLNYSKITENNILIMSDDRVKNFKGELIDTSVSSDQDINHNAINYACKISKFYES